MTCRMMPVRCRAMSPWQGERESRESRESGESVRPNPRQRKRKGFQDRSSDAGMPGLQRPPRKGGRAEYVAESYCGSRPWRAPCPHPQDCPPRRHVDQTLLLAASPDPNGGRRRHIYLITTCPAAEQGRSDGAARPTAAACNSLHTHGSLCPHDQLLVHASECRSQANNKASLIEQHPAFHHATYPMISRAALSCFSHSFPMWH